VLESFAAVISGNLVPMGRPILSNALFFIRSAAWAPPVMVLGYFYPEFRNAETIFAFWLAGIVLSLMVNAAVWRKRAWRQAFATPVNTVWIIACVKGCFFIWLGGVAAAITANIDRFVVEFFIGREAVGIVSFYGSFVAAVLSLMASGVFTFVYPALIKLYKAKQLKAFRAEAIKATWHAAVFSAGICIAMGIIIPYFGVLFERPELSEYAPIFWMLLLAVWIRTATDIFYYVLYAWSEDTVLWTTSLVSLAVALAVNIFFIAQYGMIGIGYGAIASSVFLGIWRLWWLRKLLPKHLTAPA
jgi:O-antigen/teichoic acid export membrane protein